jgi:hypothetical protein
MLVWTGGSTATRSRSPSVTAAALWFLLTTVIHGFGGFPPGLVLRGARRMSTTELIDST